MPETKSGSGYYTRLGAALAIAGVLAIAIVEPRGRGPIAERLADAMPTQTPMEMRTCPAASPALTTVFAPLEDVVSVSPLGGVTAPGEPLPAPYIRINTKRADNGLERRATTALAPATADISAIERRRVRDEAGRAVADQWTVRFRVCKSIAITYDDLDAIDPKLIEEAGGLAAFAEVGGPDHLAIATRIRVKAGAAIGSADGFDVALHDLAAEPTTVAAPERYRPLSYARSMVFNIAPDLAAAIASNHAQAQCPLDYLPRRAEGEWKAKLGDAWGLRRAEGEDACRTALVDVPGAAQGAWFTDRSLNAASTKVSAIALAPDAVDPSRLVFALHGRLRSLSPDLVALAPPLEEARAAAARDFLTFTAGEGRINPPFAAVKPGEVYCYEGLRANFVGPRINGVLLLQMDPEAPAPLMRIEARAEALSCSDLPEPWRFTGAETIFYR